jgi:hypothetical protein
MEGRKCMRCKTTTTRLSTKHYQVWYLVREKKEIIGYHCAKCYDSIRRFPFFKNFKEKLKQRVCSNCGSHKTTLRMNGGGYPTYTWSKDRKGGFWCSKCYQKITRDPEKVRARNRRQIFFKDRVIYLSKNPRTGVCSLCGNKVGKEIKKTDMHHIEYHDDDPLKDTIELCAACHMKESLRIKNIRSLRWNTPIGDI